MKVLWALVAFVVLVAATEAFEADQHSAIVEDLKAQLAERDAQLTKLSESVFSPEGTTSDLTEALSEAHAKIVQLQAEHGEPEVHGEAPHQVVQLYTDTIGAPPFNIITF